VRRIALVALAFMIFAPAAHAACAGAVGATTGAAPLTVTFTSQCASEAVTWDFGDGTQATGQSVQHTYAAGYWRPTLTTDTGAEPAPAVTSIALSVNAPRVARYAQYVALTATVVPRIPVTYRGRQFLHGKLRVRVLRATPWVVHAGNVTAQAHTLVRPTLVVRTPTAIVGAPARIVAALHPASAGRLVVPRLDTGTAHVAHLTVTTRPAPGWAKVSEHVTVPVVLPSLAAGDRGPSVLALERRLATLHYAVQADGVYGDDDVEAIYAFEKVQGLPRTGRVDAALWRRLLAAHTPAARFPGDHVEIDKARQVLFVVRGGKVTLIVATSTGATGNTPLGVWHVYRKVDGFDWVLYYPSYFLRGFAVHGYPDVPPYPASHGCARIPMWIAQTVYAQISYGSTVYVYQ
jgi:lipoprotein-anchoring transpeptidase ErfK/SrfK